MSRSSSRALKVPLVAEVEDPEHPIGSVEGPAVPCVLCGCSEEFVVFIVTPSEQAVCEKCVDILQEILETVRENLDERIAKTSIGRALN